MGLHGLIERELVQSLGPCFAKRASRFDTLARCDEMVCDFRPARLAISRPLLEDESETGMCRCAILFGNCLVDQLSNEEVHEPIPLGRDLGEDGGVRGLLRDLDVACGFLTVAGFEKADVELATDDSTAPQHLHACRRHGGQSLLDRSADRRRDRGGSTGTGASLGAPQTGDLHEKQGVAVGGAMERAHERRFDRFA